MRLGLCMSVMCGMLAAAIAAISPQAARAQAAALEAAEPQRFALVIGNGKYTGDLPALGSPCHQDPANAGASAPGDPPGDAEVMVDALKAAGWTDVDKACNLTRSALRDRIDAFVDKIQSTPRAFGVIYFSGHGAQVEGRNYLFGVDADIEPDTEVAKWAANRNARLFGQGAVELEGALGPLNPFFGKALVVIIDACRNNPVLDDMRKAKLRGLSYPTRSEGLDGIVMAFASKKGVRAPDGGIAAASPFTRELAARLTSAAQMGNVKIEDLIAQANTAVETASHGDQQPRRVGELRQPPQFCLKGCPSPLLDWKTANDVVSGDLSFAPVPELPGMPALRQAAASDGGWGTFAPAVFLRGALGEGMPRRIAVQAAPAPPPVAATVPATSPTMALPPADKKAVWDALLRRARTGAVRGPVQAPADTLRQFAIDVYWCTGDAHTEAHRAEAAALKQALDARFSASAPVPGFRLGIVRLAAFDPQLSTQTALNKRIILVDKDSQSESAWAEGVRAAATNPFTIQARKSGASPDRISVFVCDAADAARVVDSVFFHIMPGVAREDVYAIKRGLSADVNGLDIVIEDQIVKVTPDATQVRYFNEVQDAKARAVAGYLARSLGHPVDAVFFPGYKGQLGDKRVLEVWIGKREMMPEGGLGL